MVVMDFMKFYFSITFILNFDQTPLHTRLTWIKFIKKHGAVMEFVDKIHVNLVCALEFKMIVIEKCGVYSIENAVYIFP
jgi:hypothetical protein